MENSPIIFLTVPSSLKNKFGSFELDPSIPLPAELKPGEKKLDPEKLSSEMILAGILKVLLEPAEHDVPEEWIDYYRRFIFTVKPEIYHEFIGAAIVKAETGEYDMALEINAALEALFPRSPGILLNKALILEKKAENLETGEDGKNNYYYEALSAYEDALSAEPVLPDTLFNAAYFFIKHRDFAKAKDCLSKYILVSEEPEKKKQAEKIIREMGEQGLDDENYLQAYDFISRGNDEMGLLKIREFIKKHPKVWNGWFVLGWALRKLGRFSDALEAFNKTVELGGGSCDTLNEMAICHMELGDLKAARRELSNALREEPENIKIISNMGVLAQKNGRNDEAAAFFRTVLELDPNDPLAKHFLDNTIIE